MHVSFIFHLFSLSLGLTWHGELRSKANNFSFECRDRLFLGLIGVKECIKLLERATRFRRRIDDRLGKLDATMEEVGDHFEVLLNETTGGEGGSTNADTTWNHGFGITRDGVLVKGDEGTFHNFFGASTIETNRSQIDQHKMVIGASGDDSITELDQFV